MTTYIYQYTSCDLIYIPNDVSIQINSYLTDASGNIVISTSTLGIDTFTIQTYKSSLPISGYDSFLSIIAGKFISDKYSSTTGGYGISGSNILTQISDTSKIVVGVGVSGTGIPVDTTVVSVRDKNSIELNNTVTATGSTTLTFSTSGWQVDYSQIHHLTEVIDFANI